jgi:hypothetical protein
MFSFQSGQLGHSTNTIILKSNEHKSHAWVFGVICTFQIIIEKEDFEVNCLYKTRWDSYQGIGEGIKIIFIKKN